MALNRNNLKQTPIPVVSRTMQIVNTDGTVTRSGQLLLQQLQASDALQGTHAGRPSPGDAPDGALYVESDRTVLYSNINGAWHYIAGTDWGTINPDQRPTDLGVNDAGFDFRTVDQPAREFIWDQAGWIEVTPVRYGTHAARLAVNVTQVIEQMLWVETDRTVLYQLMLVSGTTPVWQYIAGTMWGTVVPDQRPTDLGTHDAGFDYRTTDQPPREFIWTGGAWVETTSARYGTHAARLAQPVANLAAGALWVETDRGDVIYQLQAATWHYLAGAMWGTVSPDQRPTDLGANDTGFAFYATDQQQEYLWNGTAWVLASPPAVNNSVLYAAANGSITLTTSPQQIPGTTLTLTKAGTYLVCASFYFTLAYNDVNNACQGNMFPVQSPNAELYYAAGSATTTLQVTVPQNWMITVSTVPTSIYLTASKTGGPGGSSANASHTTITALWVSP